ncbi:tripartite tricarboxylate transporter substrate binding protein [Candidimonas humi]|uniref:Bug family tripartite tricarboxylate transporter substrate binding protein n=1 Tax=Candidimonas humi TaxID=683355 RepID=A0ABV8P2R2_9BURK|nr:tripartite tricarboxylate transporter substrate binding protein [Candidimonas humi]MBV6307325.1 tripartite tricarboxylate transporter substrate binding protein [Candidimonas humi]
MIKRLAVCFWACTVMLCVAPMGGAWAAGYPSHPVHLVVPYPPGGSADILGRVMGKALQEQLGQAVIVDNRPGAGTLIGARYVANAPPDGYTLLMGTVSSNAMTPAVNPQAGYDPVKSFTPVARLASMPFVLLTRPTLHIKDFAQFLKLAKSKPGSISYGSAGLGTSNHLAGVLLSQQAGIRLTHIPFRGSAPAMNALLGGQVDAMFDLVPTSIAHIHAGTVDALATTGARRSPFLPKLPTLAELGVHDYQVTAWFGIFGPAGMPADVTALLSRKIEAILAMPDVKQQFERLGITPEPQPAPRFAAFVNQEVGKWRRVVQQAGLAQKP